MTSQQTHAYQSLATSSNPRPSFYRRIIVSSKGKIRTLDEGWTRREPFSWSHCVFFSCHRFVRVKDDIVKRRGWGAVSPRSVSRHEAIAALFWKFGDLRTVKFLWPAETSRHIYFLRWNVACNTAMEYFPEWSRKSLSYNAAPGCFLRAENRLLK
jgi:hypothetical protein